MFFSPDYERYDSEGGPYYKRKSEVLALPGLRNDEGVVDQLLKYYRRQEDYLDTANKNDPICKWGRLFTDEVGVCFRPRSGMEAAGCLQFMKKWTSSTFSNATNDSTSKTTQDLLTSDWLFSGLSGIGGASFSYYIYTFIDRIRNSQWSDSWQYTYFRDYSGLFLFEAFWDYINRLVDYKLLMLDDNDESVVGSSSGGGGRSSGGGRQRASELQLRRQRASSAARAAGTRRELRALLDAANP